MAELAKVIDLYVAPNGQIRRVVVDGINISGMISGTTVQVRSEEGVETTITLALTAPTINYIQLQPSQGNDHTTAVDDVV